MEAEFPCQHEPRDFQIPTLEELENERKTFYTEKEKEHAWTETAKVVELYSDNTVKRWKEEIDTHLVFAGLFSAVVTAFNVQSYPLLQPPAIDPTLAVLQTISLQLASFRVEGGFINSTAPGLTSSEISPPSRPPRWIVWLNITWFSALILGLSAAVVGLVVKQWIHEYCSGLSGSSRGVARLRQRRLNGLIKWKVATIVEGIGILLQLGLDLFLAGLLILLWAFHPAVAGIASSLVFVLFAFFFCALFLPIFVDDCPYLAPQSIFLHRIFESLRYTKGRLLAKVWKWSRVHALASKLERLHVGGVPALVRYDFARRIYNWLHSWSRYTLPPRHWQGRERLLVSREQYNLDADLVVTAYTMTMDPNLLLMASVCFTDLPRSLALKSFENIYSTNVTRWGPKDTGWPTCHEREVWNDGLFTWIACLAQHDHDSGTIALDVPRWLKRSWCTAILEGAPSRPERLRWLAGVLAQYLSNARHIRFQLLSRMHYVIRRLFDEAHVGKYGSDGGVLQHIAHAACSELAAAPPDGPRDVEGILVHFIMLDIVFRALSLDGIPDGNLENIKRSARDALHRLPERFTDNPGWRAFLDFHPGELVALVELVSEYGSDLISEQAAKFLEEASRAWRPENAERSVILGLNDGGLEALSGSREVRGPP